LVKPEEKDKKVGSILIPETATINKHRWGTILEIGDIGGQEVNVGDRVLYSTSGVVPVDLEDGVVHVVPYDSLLIWAL
jgi:co-chaperonin GroES (HSP10)